MAESKCAKAVMIAAIAATTLVGPAVFHPEVALSSALKSATPLSNLHSAATDLIADVHVDQGNNHIHIVNSGAYQENGFDV